MNAALESTVKELRETIFALKAAEARRKRLLQRFQALIDNGVAENDGEPGRYSYDGLTLTNQTRTKKIYHKEIEAEIAKAKELTDNAKAKAEEFGLYEKQETHFWRCDAV